MNVYLAGPMRGIYEFNFPLFFKAEEYLTAKGLTVLNPARKDDEQGLEWRGTSGDLRELPTTFDLRDALKYDTTWICKYADAVAVLPGWERSSGAKAEAALGLALGLEVWALHPVGPNRFDFEDITSRVVLRAAVGEK